LKIKEDKEEYDNSVVLCDNCGSDVSEIGDLRGNHGELLSGCMLELSELRAYDQNKYFCSEECLYNWIQKHFKKRICGYCREFDCKEQSHKGWGKEQDEYCEGCKHMKFEKETNAEFCELNKEPKPHPDEPEHLFCESKGDEKG